MVNVAAKPPTHFHIEEILTMAIKLSGSISRKVPIEGVQFSSQSFGASMEVETGSDNPAEIQGKLRQLYACLNDAIDEQIAVASNGNGSRPAASPTNRLPR